MSRRFDAHCPEFSPDAPNLRLKSVRECAIMALISPVPVWAGGHVTNAKEW